MFSSLTRVCHYMQGRIHKIVQYYQLFTYVKLGLNIAVKNVLQVYVTTTTIFYTISSQKVREHHLH